MAKAEDRIVEMLKHDEGYRRKPYTDSVGVLTVAHGRNLVDVGISREEADYLLRNDVDRAEEVINRESYADRMSGPRYAVLVNMAVNLGGRKFRQFKKMRAALRERDYDTAADEMLDSRWATQVPQRAKRLASMMRLNRWNTSSSR